MPPADPPKAEDFYRGFKQGTGFQLPEDTTVSIFLTAWVACCIFIRRVCYERILLKSATVSATFFQTNKIRSVSVFEGSNKGLEGLIE